MGKVVGAIFNSIMGPVTGLIVGGTDGLLTGLANLATAYIGGPTAALVRTATAVAYALQASPKPDTAENAVKMPRPPRVSAYGESRLFGAYALYETASDGSGVDVYFIHDGEIEQITQLYLNDDKVSLTGSFVNAGEDGRYDNNKLRMFYTMGSPTGSAIAAVVSLLPGIWTTNHRGDGLVQLAVIGEAVKAKNFLDIYPNGFPTGSMAAKWQRCPDPFAEDPTDENAWTWTENPIRHFMHYLLVREGVSYLGKIAPTLGYWKAAATVCDEAIALKAGGTEPRYRSCVAHRHIDQHAAVKAAIMQTCDGWFAPRSDGAIVVYAGKFYEPTVTIGPDEIVAFEWNGVGIDDDAAVNELAVSYRSAEHDYNTVETDAWRDEDDILKRGQVLSENFEIQVPSWGQGRRLAKRYMARKNTLYRGSVTTNRAGRGVRGERYIRLRIEEAGVAFYDGPVEIVAVTRNVQSGGVTFDWVAADPNIDAWNPATEEGDPAPVGNRVAAQPLETPTITSATPELDATGTGARIRIVVDGYDREDITWFARWRSTTDASWNEQEYSDVDPGPAALLVTSVVPTEIGVDVAVAYAAGDGRVSEWSATSTVSTSTADLAPAPNTSFTATGGVGQITGGWSNSTSSNFGHSELWIGTTSSFGSASQEGADYTGSKGVSETFTAAKAAGTWYVWTVAFNAAGTASARTGPIAVTVT